MYNVYQSYTKLFVFFYEARWLRDKPLYEMFHKRNAHSVHKDG